MTSTAEHPSLESILTTFKDAVEWATECHTVWGQSNETLPRGADTVWNELEVRSLTQQGTPQRRTEDQESLTPPVVSDYPMKSYISEQYLLSVQVRTRSRANGLFGTGYIVAARGRTRMLAPYALDNFWHCNQISIANIGPVVNIPILGKEFDDRAENEAVCEYRMNIVLTETDAASAGTYIEETEISSTIKNPGGVPLDDTLQLTDEVLP